MARLPTGIRVPSEIVESLKSSKRPPVRVTINGHTYRSTVAPMGGEFLLPVSAENRELAGVEVDVEVELDTEPREVTVPPDFRNALDRDTDAKRFFDGLSKSSKQRVVLSIEGAKTAETRLRRITKAISELREFGREEMAICQTSSNAALHGAGLACFLRKPGRLAALGRGTSLFPCPACGSHA